MSAVSCFLISLITLLAGTVIAAAEADDPALRAFTTTPFYMQLLNRAISGLPPVVFRRCQGLVSQGSRVIVLRSVAFGPDGYPNRGAWKQTFPVSGCGNDTTLNLYFQATPDEKINTTVAYPGSSIADLRLQADAQRFASLGAAARNPSCRAFTVINTRFDSFGTKDPPMPDPGAGHGRRPWSETWTMSGCDHSYDVVLDFIPSNSGTQIIQLGTRVVEH